MREMRKVQRVVAGHLEKREEKLEAAVKYNDYSFWALFI